MRKIKFRAWDKEGKKMLYDGIAVSNDIPFYYESSDYDLYEHSYGGLELMQYTGLKDKNNKEIFEGDILEYKDFTCPNHKGVWFVKWNGYCWDVVRQFKGLYPGDRGIGCFEGKEFFWKNYDRMKVIGNIYQNKELI